MQPEGATSGQRPRPPHTLAPPTIFAPPPSRGEAPRADGWKFVLLFRVWAGRNEGTSRLLSGED